MLAQSVQFVCCEEILPNVLGPFVYILHQKNIRVGFGCRLGYLFSFFSVEMDLKLVVSEASELFFLEVLCFNSADRSAQQSSIQKTKSIDLLLLQILCNAPIKISAFQKLIFHINHSNSYFVSSSPQILSPKHCLGGIFHPSCLPTKINKSIHLLNTTRIQPFSKQKISDNLSWTV